MTRAEETARAGREALAMVRATPSLDAPSRAQAVRALARWLALDHPGHLVELRIPPFVAVQLGFADATGGHRRGTPPNVVETDPDTFLALVTGATSWTSARAANLVHASGARSDLGPLFPLGRHP
ncbi:MAG: sterol carrier family protein [Propionibacteriaceae bacterium]